MTDIYSRLQAAAHAGAFGVNELALPTAEQCKAGNYAKGRVTLHGMPIAIEVPQGQRRMGKSDGKPWSTILMAHYGYLAGTKGADGDALDVFIGPVPESSKVWVVNQVGKGGEFDEHKLLIGFLDEDSARAAYMNSYERGWTGLGSLVACSMFQLKWWVKYGNTTKPLTEQALPHDGNNDMNETAWDSAAEPVGCDFADLIYRLRRDDSDGLMLDAVSVADIMESSDGEETLDALVVQYNKADRKAEQLRRIMESVGGEVTPASVQVTPPFKQRGTTNVVFLYELSDGQTVSIWMHNPDSTPNRILPQDELVSWRWMLNKKDITLLVAPERGQDLNPREVSRRIMKLAQKNSARFATANATRAARMQSIDGLKGAVAEKEAELAALDTLFADLTEKVEAKRARRPATLETNDQEGATRREPEFDPTTPEGYQKATQDEALQEAHQDQLDSFFQGRIIEVRNALRDLGWEGERHKPLSKTASTGDIWKFEPRYKQVGAGANIVEFYPQLYIYRDGQKVQTENWATEDRLTLSPAELAALIDSVVPQTKPEPEPQPEPEPEPQPQPEPEPQAEQTRDQWEGAVAEIIAETLGITTSDAQGIVQAQDFYMTQSWGKGMPAQETAEKIMAESKAPEDEQLQYAREFLQSVIDGDVDFMDEGLADRLEKIHDDYADDEGLLDLFGQAAQAYSDYMVEQARAALA